MCSSIDEYKRPFVSPTIVGSDSVAFTIQLVRDGAGLAKTGKNEYRLLQRSDSRLQQCRLEVELS